MPPKSKPNYENQSEFIVSKLRAKRHASALLDNFFDDSGELLTPLQQLQKRLHQYLQHCHRQIAYYHALADIYQERLETLLQHHPDETSDTSKNTK